MKLFELLDEIKIGDETYQELKISEDIEEDVDSLEEGTRFVRINRRLNKIHDRLSSKVGDMKELKSIVRNIGRTSNVFEHAEDLFWKGLNPSQAQARAKMISVKKNFEKILSELLDRDVKRMKVYKICKWPGVCPFFDENVTDDGMYIGRIQVNLNNGRKRKFLYFQTDYKIRK